jgi:hypothetical protein
MDDDHEEFLLTEGSRRAARHWRDTCWVFVTGLDQAQRGVNLAQFIEAEVTG